MEKWAERCQLLPLHPRSFLLSPLQTPLVVSPAKVLHNQALVPTLATLLGYYKAQALQYSHQDFQLTP